MSDEEKLELDITMLNHWLTHLENEYDGRMPASEAKRYDYYVGLFDAKWNELDRLRNSPHTHLDI